MSEGIDHAALRAAAAPDEGLLAFEYAPAPDAADREAKAIAVYRRSRLISAAPREPVVVAVQ